MCMKMYEEHIVVKESLLNLVLDVLLLSKNLVICNQLLFLLYLHVRAKIKWPRSGSYSYLQNRIRIHVIVQNTRLNNKHSLLTRLALSSGIDHPEHMTKVSLLEANPDRSPRMAGFGTTPTQSQTIRLRLQEISILKI